MKAVVFTLGCKVNSCESAFLMEGLAKKGYEVADNLSYADLYILNTCAVTREAEKKSRQAVSRIKSVNPNAKIIVTGCAAINNPKAFKEKSGVSLVAAVLDKHLILDNLFYKGILKDDSFSFKENIPFNEVNLKSRTYIKVQDGCNNFCSYCIIPHLRKASRSKPIELIKKELNYVKANEVVLTGINLSAFNDNGKALSDLVAACDNYLFRVRLGSLEENIVDEKFIIALKGLKNFAPHFHLSLQSGSDKVLADMNRRYLAEDYLKSVKLIYDNFENAAVTTDVIVGFPTETEDDFEKTIELCKKAQFADIHCFPYSKREGTPAALLKQVSDEVKAERFKRLTSLKMQLKREYICKFINKTLNFLAEETVDGFTEGYTENYIKVYLKGEYPLGFYKVVLTEPYLNGSLAVIKE